MQGAHDGEKQQRGSQQITREKHRIASEADQQHLLPRKAVCQIATEGSDQQRQERIARQCQPDDIFRRSEMLAQIERQERRKQVEREIQAEIGVHHFQVVSIPQTVHRQDTSCIFGCKGTLFPWKEQESGLPPWPIR